MHHFQTRCSRALPAVFAVRFCLKLEEKSPSRHGKLSLNLEIPQPFSPPGPAQEGSANRMRRPAYTVHDGCIYVTFTGASPDAPPLPPSGQDGGMLFTEFMQGWLHLMSSQVRHNTLDSYWYMFHRHIEPFYNARHMTLRSATLADFQAFVDEKYREGYSPTSIVKFHSIVHKCLRYAVTRGIIDHNPSDYVMLPKRVRYIGQTFDQEQLNRFLQAAHLSPAEPAFVLAATYGMRRSEVAGLRWQAIDFRRNSLVVNHTAISSHGQVTYSDRVKTDSSYRTLPLMRNTKEYLLHLQMQQQQHARMYGAAYVHTDYVCCRENGKPLRPDYISQEFARVCRSANLPHIRFHDLRHSAATLLLKEGFSLKQIQEWLGHADITTTANTYAHVTYSDKVQMAKRMDGLFHM